ncbi:MAG TPA: acetate--CoA ligase family protein [Xanthobacteraceae bacterium]|jgi:acyl-CoA synthetase (NDP forming)|nr:acetate--CoA ligase family protein [Xanthobacteraceae bacterium]
MGPLDNLLRPRSVAIIGASADAAKLAGRPLLYLEKYGFHGDIWPVNPRYEAIGGHRCFPEIAALPQPPDVAMVLVGTSKVTEAVRQLAAIGTETAIVLASGFGESGLEGKARQDELIEAAGAMRLLGPNTIGLVNVSDGVVLSASNALVTDDIIPGAIALVSQSGGILGSLLSRAQALGIGFSKLIATGNECDLDVSDFIGHLADDAATRVIALYLEGLRRPEAFRDAVRRTRQAGKTVVAFKVGRSESGARSAASHTGALAGSDAAYDALFWQTGVIRAERYSDLLDIPLALSSGRRLTAKRVAVITSTGGAASLLADAAGMAGFATPPPDDATAAKLKALAIEGATLDRNPIDVTLAGVKSETFRVILDVVTASPIYDAVVVVLGSSALREPETASRPLRECALANTKPIIGFASPDAPQLVRQLNLAGVPTFAAPESCATALAAMRRAAEADAPEQEPAPTKAIAEDARDLLKPGVLNEAESKRLFASFGVPITREIVATTPAEAEVAAKTFGGNVVLKILSRNVMHKTEAGGVAIGVAPSQVADTCAQMAGRFTKTTGHAPEGFLVQELISGGIELILGFHRDPQLGPIVLLGMGGVAAEVYRDTVLRFAPLTRRDALEMIGSLKSAPLLNGFRGRPQADIAALIETIVAFSGLVVAIGDELDEAEINPLFVLSQGRGVVAADGVVVVSTFDNSVSGRTRD